MKTILYYFTGTGNSLAVAKAISSRLPETELVPIPKLMLAGERITVPADANVGIVYPLYAMGLPKIVVNFFALLDLSPAGYVFSVVTEGGKSGSPTKQISALCEKSGHMLNAAWWIQMPDNYIPLSAPPEKSVEKTIRENALRKVAVIVEDIKNRQGSLAGFTAIGSFMICVRICPVNNIRPLPHGKKEWLHTCEGCLACLQFCPVEALSCGGKTANRPRYHHANATVEDMLEQKGSIETN